jgi:hypothetical protein
MQIETLNVIHHDGILTGLTVKTAIIYFTFLGKERRISLWLYPMDYDRAEGIVGKKYGREL